jgi:hypothetical protein
VNNDIGAWGSGFVLAVSKRWPEPEQDYREWFTENPRPALGQVSLVRVEDDLWVANMIAQRGIRWIDGVPPIRYGALECCLEWVAEEALSLGASVHGPRFGSALAGGDWRRIEDIIQRELVNRGVDVTIYDLP